jgi:hypothetical protein
MRTLPDADRDCYELDDLLGMQPEVIDGIEIGDHVKLVFRIRVVENDVEEWFVERMWVLITECDGDFWIGELANDPACGSILKLGDSVTFLLRHVYAKYRVG